MGVLAIWRYPVKAMLGELLHAVEVGAAGCHGDRRWAVVDSVTGERIANKRGPTHPALRACRAELLDAPGEALPLRITLPDGTTLTGAEIEEALCGLLDRRVHLEEFAGPATAALGAPAAHHDFAPVHVMTTSTLAHLRSVAPQSDFDARRFRPNLLLDDGAEPGAFGEDALIGRSLRAPSGCELRVDLPTPRCVVPTRAHEELPADPAHPAHDRPAPSRRPGPVRPARVRGRLCRGRERPRPARWRSARGRAGHDRAACRARRDDRAPGRPRIGCGVKWDGPR